MSNLAVLAAAILAIVGTGVVLYLAIHLRNPRARAWAQAASILLGTTTATIAMLTVAAVAVQPDTPINQRLGDSVPFVIPPAIIGLDCDAPAVTHSDESTPTGTSSRPSTYQF